MQNRVGIGELTSLSDLISSDDNDDIESRLLSPYKNQFIGTGIREIIISMIDDFPNHPFSVNDDGKMAELAEDISKYGVLHPVIVRETADGRYQMISGHRRAFASQKAGLSTIPARIMKLSDEDSIILMTNANFLQRTEIKPSEKARAYRMKYEAIKRQGKRGTGNSLNEIGMATKESGKTVQRFIRLSYLSDELLDMIDKNKLGISQGVEMSYLDVAMQAMVYESLRQTKVKMTRDQAFQIRSEAKRNCLSIEIINHILIASNITERTVTITPEIMNQYFDENVSAKEAEVIICRLLSKWKGGQEYV